MIYKSDRKASQRQQVNNPRLRATEIIHGDQRMTEQRSYRSHDQSHDTTEQ